jgi:hypothetical protein
MSFKTWWNTGRDVRVPGENTASIKTLYNDDMSQLTKTNKSFQSGTKGLRDIVGPFKAFTPSMVATGPSPAVRQAFERTGRFLGSKFNPATAVVSTGLDAYGLTSYGLRKTGADKKLFNLGGTIYDFTHRN